MAEFQLLSFEVFQRPVWSSQRHFSSSSRREAADRGQLWKCPTLFLHCHSNPNCANCHSRITMQKNKKLLFLNFQKDKNVNSSNDEPFRTMSFSSHAHSRLFDCTTSVSSILSSAPFHFKMSVISRLDDSSRRFLNRSGTRKRRSDFSSTGRSCKTTEKWKRFTTWRQLCGEKKRLI